MIKDETDYLFDHLDALDAEEPINYTVYSLVYADINIGILDDIDSITMEVQRLSRELED